MHPLLGIAFHEFGGGGILSGFLHPLLGLDHLLAMISVGLLSTQLGGRAIWTVPATFVGVMAVGGALGIVGLSPPAVEYVITGSVVLLGIAILTGGQISVPLAIGLVALFGFVHGNAHGTELPAATDTLTLTIAYVAGFLIATSTLHLVGVFLGMIAERRQQRGLRVLQASGAMLVLLGILLMVRV